MIADDHALIRDGTRRILEQEPDLQVVAEAGDGEEAVQMALRHKPDVAIIDIAMPVVDGIEATRRIKELDPAIAILILTAYDDDEFVFNLLESGAAGYLLKKVRGQELIDAVRAVYNGESVLHPSIARKVVNRLLPSAAKSGKKESTELLSSREMDIIKLVIKGQSNKDIADELSLSVRTVQGHLGRMFDKLGVSSRTEAVVRALKEGWVTLDDLP